MNPTLIRNTLVLRQHYLQKQLVSTEVSIQQPVHLGGLALSNNSISYLEHSANKIAAEIVQVKQVLRKMGYPSYGVCQHCGDPIDKERLEVQPCTTLCRFCATAH